MKPDDLITSPAFVGTKAADACRDEIKHGNEDSTPGCVRRNQHHAMDDATVEPIISGVRDLAENWDALAKHDGPGKEKGVVSDQRVIV